MNARALVVLAALGLLGAGLAPAQNITLKDGQVIAALRVERSGATILATVVRQGQEDVVGKKVLDKVGQAVGKIARIDFPRPRELTTGPQLILQGRAGEALAQIDPVVREQENFLDVPGSWWAPAALLKVQALLAVGNGKQAEPLIEKIARTATDPETKLAAKVFEGSTLARRGEHAQAVAAQEKVLEAASHPATLAAAAFYKGESHLALKQYDLAVLAYLRIPVFHPTEKLLLPQAMLGLGRAFLALEDFPRAREELDRLIAAYGSTAQAKDAQAELARIARREKALAPSNL